MGAFALHQSKIMMKPSTISNSAALIACLCMAANPAQKNPRSASETKDMLPTKDMVLSRTGKEADLVTATFIRENMPPKNVDFALKPSFEPQTWDDHDAGYESTYYENLEPADSEWDEYDGWDEWADDWPGTSSLQSGKAQRRKEVEWDGGGRQHSSRTSTRRQAW